MNTPESHREIAVALVRRGVPSDYAERSARELADHHRDLVEELQAAGMSKSQAVAEASRRLGDSRTLVRRTVREYQRRYWCARWPILTFIIAPPVLLALIWVIACLSMVGFTMCGIGLFGKTTLFHALDTSIGDGVVVLMEACITFGSTPLVMVAIHWLAVRAAMSRCWPVAAAISLATLVGFVTCDIKLPTPTDPTYCATLSYSLWFLPESWDANLRRALDPWLLCQLLLPLGVCLLSMVYRSHRRCLIASEC